MPELAGALALLAAAAFAGAACYVSIAEHPARMALDDGWALRQWKPSYANGKIMQAALALIGALLAFWMWWEGRNLIWLIGGLALLANWPFTLAAIMPTNRRLEALSPDAPAPETRALLIRWGRLHAVRAALGGASALIMVCAFYCRL
ncbi:MAG TPA: DUF1772 domain-containing protein [Allosphingosinicella sp.]|nr:DUF1772 domain-containing protein [Allosphingosinicella sp.]